jgi:hypothetical protein
VYDVVDKLVIHMAAVGDKPHVTIRAVDVGATREHRHHARNVAVADVVLLPRRAKDRPFQAVGAFIVACRRQQHVGVVDVCAMLALGERECHHAARLELLGRALLGLDVVALPNRPKA